MTESSVFLEDLRSVIDDNAIDFEKLRGKNVLITGATGFLGNFCVRVLSDLNSQKNYGIKIIAVGRNIEKGAALEKLPSVYFLKADLRQPLLLNGEVDYILHLAAVTKSAEMVGNPVGVMETELSGIKNVLELARAKNVKGFVYTSSMESYGIMNKTEIFEEDQGYIDLASPRSCYPQSKRTAELLCNCYYTQYSLPVNMLRLGMTFGAGAKPDDKRVFAQFARDAVNGDQITLHTEGNSIRSFIYSSDAVKAMLLALLSDTKGQTYNVATQAISIRELAEIVAGMYGMKVMVNPPSDLEKMGYQSDFCLPLNTNKIKKAGWKPSVMDVRVMYERLLKDWEKHIGEKK
jgi:nucleoside-diphosphate-sugar epimerase